MSIPHDYYGRDSFPDLHNRGEGHPYVEPDWFAHSHDGALPVISTIGRGPKGDSVSAKKDGSDLVIENDFGEEVARFTVGDWSIDIQTPSTGDISGGNDTYFDVIVNDGSTERSTRVTVPCGPDGSRVYFPADGSEYYPKQENNTYVVRGLVWSQESTADETAMPEPRVGDICILPILENEEKLAGFGVIEAIGEDVEGEFFTVFAPQTFDLHEIYNPEEHEYVFETTSPYSSRLPFFFAPSPSGFSFQGGSDYHSGVVKLGSFSGTDSGVEGENDLAIGFFHYVAYPTVSWQAVFSNGGSGSSVTFLEFNSQQVGGSDVWKLLFAVVSSNVQDSIHGTWGDIASRSGDYVALHLPETYAATQGLLQSSAPIEVDIVALAVKVQ